ncbi:MAG: hypothetical protein ACTSRG_26765 [Candidatus Helarchaeota archaeon]
MIFTEKYGKTVRALKISKKLKNEFLRSYPNIIVFILLITIVVLLNFERIFSNKLNTFHYYDLMGYVSIILIWVEIWQGILIFPLAYSCLTSLVLAPNELKKIQIQKKIKIKKDNLNELQKLCISSIEIYVLFLGIYTFMVLFDVISENFIIISIYIFGWIVIGIFLFHTLIISFRDIKKQREYEILEETKKETLFKEIYKVGKIYKNWDAILEVLQLSEIKFNNYFENILENDKNLHTFIDFYNKNRVKNIKKIKILLYITNFKKFNNNYCVADNIQKDLGIKKATLYLNINKLHKEELIQKGKKESGRVQVLIPSY